MEGQDETAESLGALGGERAWGIEAVQGARVQIFTLLSEARI